MTNPTNPGVLPATGAPPPAGVPGQAPVPAPQGTPAPDGAPAPAPESPAIGGDDASLLAQQMSARFSIVKRTEGDEGENKVPGNTGAQAPAAPPQAAAPVPQPAAAPAPTVPPTSG